MLEKGICEKCLDSCAVDLDNCVDDYEEGMGISFESYWERGLVPCPPDFVLVSHESALKGCPKRGTHEGTAYIFREKGED